MFNKLYPCCYIGKVKESSNEKQPLYYYMRAILHIDQTEQVTVAVTLYACVRAPLGSNSARTPTALKEVYLSPFRKILGIEDRLCVLVVRVLGYTTEMYCDSCEVQTEFIYIMWKKVDRLCGLVVRVPGYRSRNPGIDSRRYQIF
jgi:hypothetical protein